jgi:hypothetical protein
MAVQNPQQDYVSKASQTTPAPADLIRTTSENRGVYSVRQGMLPGIHIRRGFVIDIPDVGRAKVLNSFYIKMQRAEEGFIAVSDISDVYELGESASQAIIHYLFSLVDELIWFQKRKESLSRSLFKDFTKLRYYVGLV